MWETTKNTQTHRECKQEDRQVHRISVPEICRNSESFVWNSAHFLLMISGLEVDEELIKGYREVKKKNSLSINIQCLKTT